MHNTLAAFSRFCALLAERSFIESKKEKEKEKKGKREREDKARKDYCPHSSRRL